MQVSKVPLIQAVMGNTIRIFTFSYEKIPGQPAALQYGMILVIVSLAKFIRELPHVNHQKQSTMKEIN